MLKWILSGLLVANAAVFGWGMLEQPAPQNLSVREINAHQIKPLAPEDMEALKLSPMPGVGTTRQAEEALAQNAQNTPQTTTPPTSASAAPPPFTVTSDPQVSAAARMAAERAATVATPAPSRSPAAPAMPAQPESKQPPASVRYCFVWSEFDAATAVKVKQRLRGAKLAHALSEQTRIVAAAKPAPAAGESRKFWVYLPVAASKDDAVKQVVALRAKGFDAYVVKKPEEFANAVSLGVFTRQASVDSLVAKLAAAGFSAKVRSRGEEQASVTTTAELAGKWVTFRVHGLDAAQRAKLEVLASEWPQATLKPQACAK